MFGTSIGRLLIVAGVIGLPTPTVFAMSSRWMTAGFNDMMHASLSLAFGLVVFGGGAVCRRLPRISALRNCHHSDPGWVRSRVVAGHSRDRTEPHTLGGAFEHINAYTYFAWLIVLAVTVHRSINRNGVALRSDERRSGRVGQPRREYALTSKNRSKR